eukprot:9448834-Heterocapsa_arctica.AAC.1
MPGPAPHIGEHDTGTPPPTPGRPINANRHHGNSEGSRILTGEPISSTQTGPATARDQVRAQKAQLQRRL